MIKNVTLLLVLSILIACGTGTSAKPGAEGKRGSSGETSGPTPGGIFPTCPMVATFCGNDQTCYVPDPSCDLSGETGGSGSGSSGSVNAN